MRLRPEEPEAGPWRRTTAGALVADLLAGLPGGPDEAKRFWDEWQAEEIPFQALERPWERADAVVRGHSGGADRLLLADAPRRRGRIRSAHG